MKHGAVLAAVAALRATVDRTRGRIWLAESRVERLGRIDVPSAGR